MRPRIVVIVGPTAVGKTELAVEWARELKGEIISADSMQVYKYLDIGTAKPSIEVRSQVPHHLIDLVPPDATFSAAHFVYEADRVIRRLQGEGKPILVVGGTGLYIRALLFGLIPTPPADGQLRQILKKQENLYEMLVAVDPLAAQKIHPKDRVRIVRALEVLLLTGDSIVRQQRNHRFQNPRYDYLKIGINDERSHLYERINKRTEEMFNRGLVEEVKGLLNMGYTKDLPPLQSLGYRHVISFLEGKISLMEAIRLTARDTRHYAKRQITWFGAEKDISWFHRRDPSAKDAVFHFLGKKSGEIS
jgi:tRNA dimethylallyltransferase